MTSDSFSHCTTCPDCYGVGRGGPNTTDGTQDDDCCACSGSGTVGVFKNGVEGLVERMRQAPDRLWMADLVGQKISVERMRDILTFALAQQPGGSDNDH